MCFPFEGFPHCLCTHPTAEHHVGWPLALQLTAHEGNQPLFTAWPVLGEFPPFLPLLYYFIPVIWECLALFSQQRCTLLVNKEGDG